MTRANSPLRDDRFDEAVRPHLSCLFRSARRLLPSDDLAWDAVQTLLVRAWQNFELPADPGPVLLSLVPRVALELRRGERRRSRHELAAAGALAERNMIEADAEHSGCEHPTCTAERAELRERIEAALASLPTELRQLVVSCSLQGRSYTAVAREQHLPVGTVRSRLNRARRLLREELQRGDVLADPTPHQHGRRRAG